MPKIMKAYKGASSQPKIEVTNNAFKITLPNRNAEPAPVSAPAGPEEIILAYLSAHNTLVRSDVDTLLGVSQSTASRILKRMVSDGLIYKEGNGRRTVYRKTE
jgi:ATP-dependent DNA helicase RecG